MVWLVFPIGSKWNTKGFEIQMKKKASTFTTDSCWKHAKCPMIEIPLDFSSGCLFLNANIWFHANTKKSLKDASTPCHLCDSCSLKLLPSIHAKWFLSATNVLLCMHYHYSLRNELEKNASESRMLFANSYMCLHHLTFKWISAYSAIFRASLHK